MLKRIILYSVFFFLCSPFAWAEPGLYSIQVASFVQKKPAFALYEKMQDLPNARIERIGRYYTLSFGFWKDRAAAEAFRSAAEQINPDALLRRTNYVRDRIVATRFETLIVPGTGDSQDILRDLAAVYEQSHPNTTIVIPDSTGSFATKAGTLGGLESAGTRTTELGRTAVRPREVDLKKFGPMYYREFARVPVAFAVHKSVPLRELTSQELCAVYAGSITNWQQLGGPNLPLVAQTRPEGSNMLAIRQAVACFKDLKVTDKGHLNLRNSNAVASLHTMEGAIGFMPLSEALHHGFPVLKLEGTDPSAKEYPVTISLGLVHMDPLTGLAKGFADFLATAEGAKILHQSGYLPVAAQSELVSLPKQSHTAKSDIVTIPGTGDSQDLLRELARDYTDQYPDRGGVVIPNSVGSDGGITAVGTGAARIGRVARLPNAKEKALHGEFQYLEFARVPVAFVVSPNAGVRNLSEQQICDIYHGHLTNWKDVGGKDLPITVQARPDQGSNLQMLRKKIDCFAGLEVTPQAHFNLRNANLVASMQTSAGAIGFMPFGEAAYHGFTTLSLNGVSPSDQRYKLSIGLGFVYKQSLSPSTQSFINYLKTEQAEKVMRETGYIPVGNSPYTSSQDPAPREG